jgi:hypothetical protein
MAKIEPEFTKRNTKLAYPITTGRNFDETCACSIPCSSRRSTKWRRRHHRGLGQ